ncbi:hypothetical protein IFR04_009736 [Cadophora malorum]|uniref:Uncharacterized protein n=1 Tax=Cadophora malorum TaxID=108018 RepID=A0A8H7W4P5_9HELO|nr:hypothetical protein IFR04_009736 [Cadophora malorum]
MAPHSKSPQSSSSKPAKKSVSILNSMLNSAFSKDSSSTTAPRGSKDVDGKESKNRREVPKCLSSKHTSKSIKFSKSKHTIEATKSATSKFKSTVPSLKISEAATVQSKMLLGSAFFKDESRLLVNVLRNSAPIRSTTPNIKTAFTSEHDKKMATRQLEIDALSEIELQEQEDWA